MCVFCFCFETKLLLTGSFLFVHFGPAMFCWQHVGGNGTVSSEALDTMSNTLTAAKEWVDGASRKQLAVAVIGGCMVVVCGR